MITNFNVARGLHTGDGLRMRIVEWSGPASYLAGGEALNAVPGIGAIEAVLPCGAARNATTGAVVLRYDHTTGKMQAFWGDNDNGADAALIEVVDTTNLSAFTTRLLILGK